MNRIYKKNIAWMLAAVMAVMSGCRMEKPQEDTKVQTTNSTEEEAHQSDEDLEVGDVISGFTVNSISDRQMLQSKIIVFTH